MPTIEMKLKPWLPPNFAQVEQPPRPKQDGVHELPSIAVADLPEAALDGLARQWLTDLYEKAGKPCPWIAKDKP